MTSPGPIDCMPPAPETDRPAAVSSRPAGQMAVAVAALVAIVSQVALVGVFTAAAVSGDDLGIFRALALGFSGPLILLTLPAALLLRAGRARAAALLAGGALIVSLLLWWTA